MRMRWINNLKISWRPLMAITLVIVLFLYLVVGFFLNIYGMSVPELSDGAWALLSVFSGSYTLSRGAEKWSANMNYKNEYGGNVTPEDDLDDLSELS